MDTPVTRFLDQHGIPYVIKRHSQPVYTCEDAARERGVRLSQIVKTMVGRDPNGGLHIMLIPGDRTLKLRRVRHYADGARVELLPPDQIRHQLGVTVGAISPTQFVGRARFYIDRGLLSEPVVDISAGCPDAGVELRAQDLQRVLHALECDIVSTSKQSPPDSNGR
jgi:Cys-tRNA(Pro) deacylase